MRRKLSYILSSVLLLIVNQLFANDGAFRGSGGSLIPITDSSISVTKEVLRITRFNEDFVKVDVYYEFFNAGEGKEILIGFEAISPFGDVSTVPSNGEHPYITNFTVNVNDSILSYKVAIVVDSVYYANGAFKEVNEYSKDVLENRMFVEFFYVYHFKCKMKKGRNVIRHTYTQQLSSSVCAWYSFDYVLSAAARWQGGVIEDFTLIIDMGENQQYNIAQGFFKDVSGWSSLSESILKMVKTDEEYIGNHLHCLIASGALTFKKQNFVPNAELRIESFRGWCYKNIFDYKHDKLPKTMAMWNLVGKPIDSLSKTILRNLPFAIQGYIFKNIAVQKYYEGVAWYKPNPAYQAKLEELSTEEQEWVLKW